MAGLGRPRPTAVAAYNRTVGSLENRVLVSARKMTELGLADGSLVAPLPVEELPRPLSVPELVDEEQVSGTPVSLPNGKLSL